MKFHCVSAGVRRCLSVLRVCVTCVFVCAYVREGHVYVHVSVASVPAYALVTCQVNDI